VADSFRSIYLINANASTATAVAIGRYNEDVYQGGNPWYLAVFAAAEQIYYAIAQWQEAGEIVVTSVSLPFFQRLDAGVNVGNYSRHSHQFNTIITAARKYAEGFIAVNQKYTPMDGSLSEQFSRATGAPLSAPDLTWS
jgi:glucoamylase